MTSIKAIPILRFDFAGSHKGRKALSAWRKAIREEGQQDFLFFTPVKSETRIEQSAKR